MHPLVEVQHLARKEFARGLRGLLDEDARKRIEPMNCISWIVGHVAQQQHRLFVAWAQGKEMEPRYVPFGSAYKGPASQPPLEEVMALWHDSCDEADVWLDTATEKILQGPFNAPAGENGGTVIVRNIFHTWCHLGEISSIRQIIGHRPPEFVNMHGWSYEGL